MHKKSGQKTTAINAITGCIICFLNRFQSAPANDLVHECAGPKYPHNAMPRLYRAPRRMFAPISAPFSDLP